jgi:beta-mannosidase
MAKHVIDLGGIWEITGFPPEPGHEPLGITGPVPGQVHPALEACGVIPDPFWRDQADQCQWVETWDWRYRRTFTLPADFPAAWAILEFEGLDTFARITLNGTVLGETANMFIPHRFEVGQWLRPGLNQLEVHFTAPAKAMAGQSCEEFFACFSRDRVRVRRMQCGFGWDWVNRFVSMGIWRPVRLIGYRHARLADLYVYTKLLRGRDAALHLEFATERRANAPLSAHVILLDPEGLPVFEAKLPEVTDSQSLDVALAGAALWWPNGQGPQPLYTCQVTLITAEGVAVDQRTTTFGIRTIELEQLPDDRGSSFTLVVNGRRVFARGGNWVPADPFPSRIPAAKYDRLLELAQRGHMNMLRAWGGGIYEPPAFWEACDRLGIMVLQDFLLACAEYPEQEPEFLAALRVEFGEAIRQLRNHPALIAWSGDNELGMNQPPDTAYNGRKIAEEVSGPLCAQLDPSRPFLPTSPYGGAINNAPNAGDCHISAWYDPAFLASDMSDYRARIRDTWGRFMSEYVTVGMPPLASVLKFANPADLDDPSARIMEYHTRDNPYNGIDDATHYQLLRRTAERLYGAHPDPRTMLRRMEYVQYEFVRLATESARARQFDCSGILFWMYNDCWPANGVSLVDYWGFAKAGYYAMKRAFQPLVACLEPTDTGIAIRAVNDAPQSVQATLTLRFQPWSGPPLWTQAFEATLPPQGVVTVTEVERNRLQTQGVLVCDLTGPSSIDRAFFYNGMPCTMDLPDAGLRAEGTRAGRQGEIRVSTKNYARVVCLEADLDFSDNYFDLLPGEERRITWNGVGDSLPGAIHVSCWNDTLCHCEERAPERRGNLGLHQPP